MPKRRPAASILQYIYMYILPYSLAVSHLSICLTVIDLLEEYGRDIFCAPCDIETHVHRLLYMYTPCRRGEKKGGGRCQRHFAAHRSTPEYHPVMRHALIASLAYDHRQEQGVALVVGRHVVLVHCVVVGIGEKMTDRDYLLLLWLCNMRG